MCVRGMCGEIRADFAAQIADGGLDEMCGPNWRSLIWDSFYQSFWVHSLFLPFGKLFSFNLFPNSGAGNVR